MNNIIDIIGCIDKYSSRDKIREYLVNLFLKEKSGRRDERSIYRYNVEICKSGKKIFLERPARLNKGMDFIIKVENESFKTEKGRNYKEAPTHYSILEDLRIKNNSNISEYNKLYCEIKKIYLLRKNINYNNIYFNIGLPVDMLLFIIKWLFIEQDITYWNYSGRRMLMDSINSI